MPKIEPWSRLPVAVRQHLIERFADRRIAAHDIEQLRAWLASSPDVPEGPWYKDFGSFKICGEGKYPKTFLLAGQPARGKSLNRFERAAVGRWPPAMQAGRPS